MFTQPLVEPVSSSNSELRKFWGADLAKLTPYQQQLVVRLFQAVKQRQFGASPNSV